MMKEAYKILFHIVDNVSLVHDMFNGYAARLVKMIKNIDHEPFCSRDLPRIDMTDIRVKFAESDIGRLEESDRFIGDSSTVTISIKVDGTWYKYYMFDLRTFCPYENDIRCEMTVSYNSKIYEQVSARCGDSSTSFPDICLFTSFMRTNIEKYFYATYTIAYDSRMDSLARFRMESFEYLDRKIFKDYKENSEELRYFGYEKLPSEITRDPNGIIMFEDIRYNFRSKGHIVYGIVARHIKSSDTLMFVEPKTSLKNITKIPTDLNPYQTDIIKGFVSICDKYAKQSANAN